MIVKSYPDASVHRLIYPKGDFLRVDSPEFANGPIWFVHEAPKGYVPLSSALPNRDLPTDGVLEGNFENARPRGECEHCQNHESTHQAKDQDGNVVNLCESCHDVYESSSKLTAFHS
jgi:hypothetical protein